MEGPGPIPWTAIDAWARRHGVHGDDFDRLVTLIRAQDQTYLEKVSENKDRGQKAGKSNDKKSGDTISFSGPRA